MCVTRLLSSTNPTRASTRHAGCCWPPSSSSAATRVVAVCCASKTVVRDNTLFQRLLFVFTKRDMHTFLSVSGTPCTNASGDATHVLGEPLSTLVRRVFPDASSSTFVPLVFMRTCDECCPGKTHKEGNEEEEEELLPVPSPAAGANKRDKETVPNIGESPMRSASINLVDVATTMLGPCTFTVVLVHVAELNRVMLSCARRGDIVCARWLRSFGVAFPWDTLAEAAEHDQLAFSQWARSNFCAWADAMCGAARGGHIRWARWARDAGCAWPYSRVTGSPLALRAAALNGRVEFAQWAVLHGAEWATGESAGHEEAAAACNGHWCFVRHARSQRTQPAPSHAVQREMMSATHERNLDGTVCTPTLQTPTDRDQQLQWE